MKKAIFTPGSGIEDPFYVSHSCERVDVIRQYDFTDEISGSYAGTSVIIRFKDGTEADVKRGDLAELPDDDRYDAIYGPNTHQFWLYDNVEDEYIDPTEEVTKKLKWMINFGDCSAETFAKAEAKLLMIAAEDPSWIHDEAYRVKEIDI